MDQDGDVDLREYLAILRRRWPTIAAVAAAAVLAAGTLSFLLPPVYEAKAVLLVARAPLQAGAAPDPMTPGVKIAAVLASDLSMGTLAAFATLPAVEHRVARLAGASVRSLVGKLSARPVPNTNLLELRVRGQAPQRAAQIANLWAAVVAAGSHELFSAEARQSYAFFDRQLGAARDRLLAADEALRKFTAASTIGLLQARVNALTGQIAGYQSRLTDLAVDLDKSETELAQIQSQIRREPEKLVLARSITADPFVREAASQAEKRDYVELSKLSMRNEELNPLYTSLDQARANASIRIAAARAEYARVSRTIAQLRGELSRLQDRLAAEQFQSTQLTRALNDAKQVYDVLVQRRDEAKVASASPAGSARVASEAVAPDVPVAPRKALNMTLGGVLGLVGGTLLAFVLEYVAAPSAETKPSSAPD